MSAMSFTRSAVRLSSSGRLGEIMPRAIAQVLRLADIEHPPLLILHQIDARRERKQLHLVRG